MIIKIIGGQLLREIDGEIFKALNHQTQCPDLAFIQIPPIRISNLRTISLVIDRGFNSLNLFHQLKAKHIRETYSLLQLLRPLFLLLHYPLLHGCRLRPSLLIKSLRRVRQIHSVHKSVLRVTRLRVGAGWRQPSSYFHDNNRELLTKEDDNSGAVDIPENSDIEESEENSFSYYLDEEGYHIGADLISKPLEEFVCQTCYASFPPGNLPHLHPPHQLDGEEPRTKYFSIWI